MRAKVLFAVLILITNAEPQIRELESISSFNQGNFEVNFAMNLGAGFSTSNRTTQYFNPYDSTYNRSNTTYSERPFNFILTSSIGYWIIDGLEIEPELDINLLIDEEISITLLANLTYNFNLKKRTTFPFITIGYGLSNYNTLSYYGNSPGNNGMDTKVFNAGIGVKLLYTAGTAMTMEINYKNYNNSISGSSNDMYNQSTYETDFSVDVVTLAFGFSVLL